MEHDKLSRVIQAMHQGILVHMADGSISHVNQAAADVLGLTLDQICGLTSLDPRWHVIHEDGSPFPGETHPSMVTLSTGEPQCDIIMGVHKPEGDLAWLSVSSEALFQEDGTTIDGVVVTFVDVTEQFEARSALGDSEKNFHSLFDNLVDTYYRVDLDGNFMMLSPSAYELSGYSPEELIGTPVAKLYEDPDGRSKFIEALTAAGGQVNGYEALFLRKDGSKVCVATSARYRYDSEGKVCCIEGTVRDVTDKKKLENELQQSERLHRTIFDSAQVGIVNCDLDGRFIKVNPYYCDYTGYSAEELYTLTPLDITHPDDQEPTKALFQARKKGDVSPVRTEKRYICKDGTVRWVEVTSNVQLDSDGLTIAWLATVLDIDERKRAEQALRDSEELFRAFFHHAPFGAVLSDHNGKIFQSNLALQNMLGYSEEELHSLHFRDYTVEEDIASNLQLFNELTDGKRESYQMEKRYRRKNGDVFWGNLAVSAVRNSDGSVKTIFSMVEDISERVTSQREQSKLQRQLQQAQKMEAIGQLTGGIAHDFNNILASILGYSELALNHLLPAGHDKLAKALAEIQRGGKRAEYLVAQMLDFSRGRPLTPEATNVESVLNEVVEMAGATIPSSVHIKISMEKGLPVVVANPVQLHQVLLNLIINARDAMDGQGAITIGVSRGEQSTTCHSCHEPFAGDYVEISVCDSAGNMSGDILRRAFDPFFTTKAVGRGTGMGLSMVHGILHDWGGHITVSLSPGKATTFHLYIPINDVSSSNGIIATSGVSNAESKSVQRVDAGQHLMVVDDEETIGRFMEEILKIHGYQVTLFTDSREAAEAFRQQPQEYDLLITDQTMPHMTGLELIEAVHAYRPELPVILCTGYSEQVNEDNAGDFGINVYLPKPVETKRLFAAIESLVVF